MTPHLSAPQIHDIVIRLSKEIAGAKPQITACAVLMDGAMIFAADLLRALYGCGVNPKTYSLGLSSYGTERNSSGAVQVTSEISANLTGEHALIIDDVLDSGATLAFARDYIMTRGAASVSACVFARKPYPGRIIDADYAGWDAPDAFLVGYGLDDEYRFRGMPGIGAVE